MLEAKQDQQVETYCMFVLQLFVRFGKMQPGLAARLGFPLL